jgi:tellurite resistance protein
VPEGVLRGTASKGIANVVLSQLFKGKPDQTPTIDPETVKGVDETDTAALRRIVAQLQELPADERRFIAGFSYVLGRVANADMTIAPEEVAQMEKIVMAIGGLPESQSVLVVQIALNHAMLYGGTDNYVITREVSRTATPEQLKRLLRASFVVAAADQTIDAEESAELDEIGRELGFADPEIRAMRAEFKDSFAAVRAARQAAASSQPAS